MAWRTAVINERPLTLKRNLWESISSGSVHISSGPGNKAKFQAIGQTQLCVKLSQEALVWVAQKLKYLCHTERLEVGTTREQKEPLLEVYPQLH